MLVKKEFGDVFTLADIMQDACLISLSQIIKSVDVLSINIFDFKEICDKRFVYKADKAEQIVKTWKNANETKFIDCKTFAVFAKCFFLLKGEKVNFCFLGSKQKFQHVCVYLPDCNKICDLLTKNILYDFAFYKKKYNFTDALIL
jgi:hypothetical protein